MITATDIGNLAIIMYEKELLYEKWLEIENKKPNQRHFESNEFIEFVSAKDKFYAALQKMRGKGNEKEKEKG